MERRKIALVGSGNIGGTLAHMICARELGDVVLLDVEPKMPLGKSLDVGQASQIIGGDVEFLGTDSYEDIEGADVIVVTAGFTRAPGKTDASWCREELIASNLKVIEQVGKGIKEYAPDAFVICVTNPLDAMVWSLRKYSGLPSNMIVGMAGALDSNRFAFFLARELGVSTKDVRAITIGVHGDEMVPLARYSSISGIPVMDFVKMGYLSEERLEAIMNRARTGGPEIVKLMISGSPYYGPSEGIMLMVESYLKDRKRLIPCSTYLSGEYGVHGIHVGVPVVLGGGGVERIIELELNDKEKVLFERSLAAVKGLVELCQQLDSSLLVDDLVIPLHTTDHSIA